MNDRREITSLTDEDYSRMKALTIILVVVVVLLILIFFGVAILLVWHIRGC